MRHSRIRSIVLVLALIVLVVLLSMLLHRTTTTPSEDGGQGSLSPSQTHDPEIDQIPAALPSSELDLPTDVPVQDEGKIIERNPGRPLQTLHDLSKEQQEELKKENFPLYLSLLANSGKGAGLAARKNAESEADMKEKLLQVLKAQQEEGGAK